MEGALGSGKSLLFTRGAVEATSASRRKRARDDARGRRGVTEHTRGSASAGGGEDNAPPKDATTGRSGLAIVKWQAPRSGHAPRREPAVRGCSYSNQLRQADVGPLHLSIAIRGLVARRPGESGLARSNPLSPSTWQGGRGRANGVHGRGRGGEQPSRSAVASQVATPACQDTTEGASGRWWSLSNQGPPPALPSGETTTIDAVTRDEVDGASGSAWSRHGGTAEVTKKRQRSVSFRSRLLQRQRAGGPHTQASKTTSRRVRRTRSYRSW